MPRLMVEVMDLSSPLGSKLAMQNAVLYPPAVFIEGKLYAKGKINTDEMAATIRKMNGESK